MILAVQGDSLKFSITDFFKHLKPNMDSIGKRKRQSAAAQYVDLEPDDGRLSQRLKIEESDSETDQTKTSPSTKKKAPVARYQEARRRIKSELDNLATPSQVPDKILRESYKRSRDLNLFMQTEFVAQHEEFTKIKESRRVSNLKVKAQATALTEAKEQRKAAEIRVDLHEKNASDLNDQLLLKVARPLSNAQIKLENVHHDYASEIAGLRQKLAQEKAAHKELNKAQSRTAATQTRTAPIDDPPVTQLKAQLEAQRIELTTLTANNQTLQSSVNNLEAQNKEQKDLLDAQAIIVTRYENLKKFFPVA